MGSLGLSFKILIGQVFCIMMLGRSYYKSVRENDRYFSPHVIIFISLYGQMVS